LFIKIINFLLKNLGTKNGCKWRCIRTKIVTLNRTYIDEGKTTILKEETEYNHLPPKNLKRQIISNQVKRKAMDDLTEKPLRGGHTGKKHGTKTFSRVPRIRLTE